MENFRIGDFIRLRNIAAYQIDRVYGSRTNIFEIINIVPGYVEVKNCKEKIPISEIESIPINGIDDFRIYYDPIIAASIIEYGEPIPIKRVDRSYYLEAFKKHVYKGKKFNDLVKEQNLEYVHDVQNFLRREFNKSELRIDAI